MRKISGIGGAVMSMLGLIPDSGSENEAIFPLLRWHQSLIDGPKIAPIFEAYGKLLDDVLDGPEKIVYEMNVLLNRTSHNSESSSESSSTDWYWATYENYHYSEADYSWTETCENQGMLRYDHQLYKSHPFGGTDPRNCTSREAANYSLEDRTSTITTVMCDCTWAASVQGYLKKAISSWQSDEEFRTDLIMGVKDACSKAASI